MSVRVNFGVKALKVSGTVGDKGNFPKNNQPTNKTLLQVDELESNHKLAQNETWLFSILFSWSESSA